MSKPKPVCEEAARWIRTQAELGRIPGGKSVLAPFTGQDYAAFKTFMHAMELYTYSDPAGKQQAIICMRHAVLAMQPKVRWIACETIPQQTDWDDRQKLWPIITGESYRTPGSSSAEAGGAA
jgi:hypothetical protein